MSSPKVLVAIRNGMLRDTTCACAWQFGVSLIIFEWRALNTQTLPLRSTLMSDGPDKVSDPHIRLIRPSLRSTVKSVERSVSRRYVFPEGVTTKRSGKEIVVSEPRSCARERRLVSERICPRASCQPPGAIIKIDVSTLKTSDALPLLKWKLARMAI